MNLYSYIIKYDDGSAPNPFFGYCTLAVCKPVIRRTSNIGDWVFGLSPKDKNYKLVYAMKIIEKMTFRDYYNDCRFQNKKPNFLNTKNYVDRVGDNFYKPLGSKFKQLPSVHSNGKKENKNTKERDLSGHCVLISDNFYYFGSEPIDLPENLLKDIKIGQGHRKLTHDVKGDTINGLISFITKFKKGLHACPTMWPPADNLTCNDDKCCCEDNDKCDEEYINDNPTPTKIIDVINDCKKKHNIRRRF